MEKTIFVATLFVTRRTSVCCRMPTVLFRTLVPFPSEESHPQNQFPSISKKLFKNYICNAKQLIEETKLALYFNILIF